ncbi:MAG: hypothetical protein QNJ51_24945 [Calothrix sp. MO_167.B12]|nr:hypothetical protein [Calothrix sp. MO_167.B12]
MERNPKWNPHAKKSWISINPNLGFKAAIVVFIMLFIGSIFVSHSLKQAQQQPNGTVKQKLR